MPEDCLGFGPLVMGDAGDLYAANRADGFDPHDDIVAMPFSSGTTGPPKGVCLSHFNLVANCVQIGAKDVMPSSWPSRKTSQSSCKV